MATNERLEFTKAKEYKQKSQVLHDPYSLFHPMLTYVTPYQRQTDRQTDRRNMPEYIVLGRISAEVGKTGN